jgi:hypothetical protein
MALGSTQPLTEMNTRCISWGKGGRCVRLTTLPPSCAVVMKSGNFNFLEPSGLLQACNGTALPLPLPFYRTAISTNTTNSKTFPTSIVHLPRAKQPARISLLFAMHIMYKVRPVLPAATDNFTPRPDRHLVLVATFCFQLKFETAFYKSWK